MLTRAQIHSWPKAELHVHLDGSLRVGTMIDLARESGQLDQLPADSADALAEAVRGIDQAGSLEGYLDWFRHTLLVMQQAESLRRIAEELIESAAEENIRYIEVRFCPLLHTNKGLTLEAVLEAVCSGLEAAGARHSVQWGVIVCALRGKHASESLHLAQLAVAFKDRGVVAFDLAGPEFGHPAKEHLQAFYHARNNLLGLTLHAGESWGPGSIRQALFFCGAHRIGHGIAAVDDSELLSYLALHAVPLEVCPTSNVQTSVAPSYEAHPIGRLVDAGIPVSINTDSRLFSTATLTEEIWRAHHWCHLSPDSIRDCVRNGFRTAFLKPGARAALLAELESAFEDEQTA